MMNRMKLRLLRLFALMIPLLVMVPQVRAQDEDSKVYDARLEGYDGNVTLDGSSTALLWLLLVILSAVVVGVMFMDAKRTHLD
jgi:hypothetical protein